MFQCVVMYRVDIIDRYMYVLPFYVTIVLLFYAVVLHVMLEVCFVRNDEINRLLLLHRLVMGLGQLILLRQNNNNNNNKIWSVKRYLNTHLWHYGSIGPHGGIKFTTKKFCLPLSFIFLQTSCRHNLKAWRYTVPVPICLSMHCSLFRGPNSFACQRRTADRGRTRRIVEQSKCPAWVAGSNQW